MRKAAFALFLLLGACATAPKTDDSTINAPWGALDYCQRHPENIDLCPN